MVRASLHQPPARDTSGAFILDTGAGFLALDLDLARRLGIADAGSRAAPVELAPRPLARLELDGLQVDQVSPVLTVDAGVMRRATGRPVLGLLGQALFRDRVLVLDYAAGVAALLPPEPPAVPVADTLRTSGAEGRPGGARSPAGPGDGAARTAPGGGPPAALAGVLSPRSVGVPFRLAGDGKVVLRARVSGAGPDSAARALTLILDTGATKSVLFQGALDRAFPGWHASWPLARGLAAPTLTGDAGAAFVRLRCIELGETGDLARRRDVDAAVLGGDLGAQLASGIGEPVDGLLGYSFLKHFRVALDYPRLVLWLDPDHGDVPDRPFEYSTVGIQLEDARGRLRVAAVAGGSPAALAGVRAGDYLVAIDGDRLPGADVITASRRLEGPPGTSLTLTLRRGSREWRIRTARRRLL